MHIFVMMLALVTPGQVDSIIAGAETAFHDYVFPDVAAKAVDMLKSNEPSYRKISDPRKLADTVTADLLAVTHDKHVRILYPLDVPQIGARNAADRVARHQYETFLNYAVSDARVLPGNVGYFNLHGFSGDAGVARAIDSAMAFLADTDALIIDLRKNHGGTPIAVETLEGYFFPRQQQITSLMTRDPDTGITTERQQYTAATVPGPLYIDKPVYVLTSSQTFSAAEQFTYDMHNLKRVTLVGETTGGGANPGGFEPLGDQFVIFMPYGRAYSPITKTNWEGTGIAPDVPTTAADALVQAYTLALHDVKKKVDSDPMLRDFGTDIDGFLADPEKALQPY
jgi:retinol-binding protein 3